MLKSRIQLTELLTLPGIHLQCCFLLNQAQYGGVENKKEHTHVRDSSQISNMHI